MSDDDLSLYIGNEPESDQIPPQYSLRDGNVFLIDATEPMFEHDPDTKTSYFSQCLETYKNILAEKLSWNETDWMGIILFGTNEHDHDPEIKHVLTWQPFEEVSINQLIKIEKTLENVEDFHKEIGSSTNYPLYDGLLHAARCLNTVKIKMPFRNIRLLTRSDNPCENDREEKYRIRIKANDCSGMNIRLSVVGLGKQWNPEYFFKELEIAAGKIEKAEDYQRTFLPDLEEEVKHASKITAKLQFTLGNGVKLGVSISTITAKTKFPKKISLKKENNEPLDGYSYYKTAEAGYSEDEEAADETGEAPNVSIALPNNVFKYQKFGGKEIKFSIQEVFKLKNSAEPGITLLGFKPQTKLDESHHLEAPKFVTYNEAELEGSKVLFAALLKHCEARRVMAICAITLRAQSASYLYTLIPNSKCGGFYAYKLPFEENIRDFSTALSDYVYNETDNICPINEETVELCTKFIGKSTIAYNPTMFQNPKLHTELANIAALAMDKDSSEIPVDSTLPNKESVCERLGHLRDRFNEAVRIHDREINIKRPKTSSERGSKIAKMDGILNFEQLVRDQTVENCTKKQLEEYLKSVGARAVGTKGDLVNMVYSLFNNT